MIDMARAKDQTISPKSAALQSRFFAGPRYKGFVDDFGLLLDLPAEKLENLLVEAPIAVSSYELPNFDGIAAKVELTADVVTHCIFAIRFILQWFHEYGAGPKEAKLWARDYIAISERSSDDIAKIENLISALVEMAGLTLLPLRRNDAVRKVFPFLEDTHATVELRAVFKSDYDDDDASDPSLDIGHHQSELLGMAPVASINIGVDLGPDLQFQVDEPGLRRLIRTLLACLSVCPRTCCFR
jgi:hypothetical protein